MTMEAELRQLEESLEGGVLGLAATYLPTGETVFYHAETIFPTASVIKIAIISELLTQAAEGRADLARPVTIRREALVPGSGVLADLTPGIILTLADLATLTISVSDNTASNLCLEAVGGPEAVNWRMREVWGLSETMIHRPIQFGLGPDDPPFTATGSPRDMMRLCSLLALNQVHSAGVSQEVLRRMGLVHDTEKLPRYIRHNPYADALGQDRPPLEFFHKTGEVTGVRNDAGVIRCGEAALVVCVYTRDVNDPRWTAAHRGCEAIARAGELLCRRFFGE